MYNIYGNYNLMNVIKLMNIHSHNGRTHTIAYTAAVYEMSQDVISL